MAGCSRHALTPTHTRLHQAWRLQPKLQPKHNHLLILSLLRPDGFRMRLLPLLLIHLLSGLSALVALILLKIRLQYLSRDVNERNYDLAHGHKIYVWVNKVYTQY